MHTVVVRVPHTGSEEGASLFRRCCEGFAAEEGVLPPSLEDADVVPVLSKPEGWRPSFLKSTAYALISQPGRLSPLEALEGMAPTRHDLFLRALEHLDRAQGVAAMRGLLVPLIASTVVTEAEVRALAAATEAGAMTDILELLRSFMREATLTGAGGLALSEDCRYSVLSRYIIGGGGGGLGSVSKVAAVVFGGGKDEEAGEGEEGGLEGYWSRMEDESLTTDERRFFLWRSSEMKRERDAADKAKRISLARQPSSPPLHLSLSSSSSPSSVPVFLDTVYDKLLRRDPSPALSPAPHQVCVSSHIYSSHQAMSFSPESKHPTNRPDACYCSLACTAPPRPRPPSPPPPAPPSQPPLHLSPSPPRAASQ